jgi:hypothetical protein
MTAEPGRATMGADAPVPPSLIVRIMLRPMTKVLNPLIRKLAGRRHFAMATSRTGRGTCGRPGAARSG